MSAGGNSLGQRVEEIVERQREKDCYGIYATDTFDIPLVTSKRTLLHIAPHAHAEMIIVTVPPDQPDASLD
jgi:hypothetical protein